MKKLHDILKKIYGILITASFFGGILPLIPFVIAMIIGGTTGEAIAQFLYKDLYPWIIALGSAGILVGLVDLYVEEWLKKHQKKEK